MDARAKRIAGIAVLLFITMGASYRTPNFVVKTQDPQLARQIAESAERYRSLLATEWLGKSIPNWSSPCTMSVRIGQNLGAGGATTFLFDRGEVYGWRMNIQGSRQRIFDSVLPHEITHMILASHFREPIPRWADEGAATSVECPSERERQYRSLYQFLTTGRGIAFNRMFAMTEYPRDVMPLYAQGFSLTDYLIRQGGRRKYVQYLESALENDNWVGALREHYGIQNVGQLQNSWVAWLRNGRPQIGPATMDAAVLASYNQKQEDNGKASVTSPPRAMASSIPVTVPDRTPSPASVSPPAPRWQPRSELADSDYSNPYAAAPTARDSHSESRAFDHDRWLDPRTLASVKQNGLKEIPSAKMVPAEEGMAPMNLPQSARQQPIQEAGQVILEWHRR